MEDNVVDLTEVKSLDQLQKELAAQQREVKAAMLTIQKLLKDLSQKNEQIKSLENMLSQTVPVLAPSEQKLIVSPGDYSVEEDIALNQLNRLRKLASERQLTLEETKIYDLLVKNKRLSRDESTINLSKNQYRDVSPQDLEQIAGQLNESNKGD